MQETHMLKDLTHGWDDNPARSLSLHKNAYIDPAWLAVDKREIFHKSWQFLCHEEKLAKGESFATANIQGQSIVAIRGNDGDLRAF